MKKNNEIIKLPDPEKKGILSVEEALYKRRSVRKYKKGYLNLKDISQILWAAQGITDKRGYRTAPSAGALYPFYVYLIVGDVENLKKGIYRYIPEKHSLNKILDGDKRRELSKAALNQRFIEEAQISIVLTAVFEKVVSIYGKRGIMYVYMEAGHISENIYLQVEALNFGTVAVGAFHDDEVKKLLNLKEETPLYIMPVGKKF